jgi:urocanate hydratase
MKIKILLALFAMMLVSVALTGCTTMADSVQARGTGKKVTYQASFDEMWVDMPEAIKAAGLQFVSANRDDRAILAQRGITAFSYGENVAIFVEQVGEVKSSVEVVSKKAMATNIFAPDWAKPIFEQLDKKFKRAS